MAPEDESEERENDHPKEYTHDNPGNCTLGDSDAGSLTVKGAIGDPGTRHETKGTCIDTPVTEVVLMYPIARISSPAFVMIKEWDR